MIQVHMICQGRISQALSVNVSALHGSVAILSSACVRLKGRCSTYCEYSAATRLIFASPGYTMNDVRTYSTPYGRVRDQPNKTRT